MVILYVMSGTAGGMMAAGLAISNGLAWHEVLGLYSAVGTIAGVMTNLLLGIVLPWCVKVIAQWRNRGAAPSVAWVESQRKGGIRVLQAR